MISSRLLTDEARQVAEGWVRECLPASPGAGGVGVALGLPEWDARLARWRVALVAGADPAVLVGEVQIDGAGHIRRAPEPGLVAERLRGIAAGAGGGGNGRGRGNGRHQRGRRAGVKSSRIAFPPIPSKAILGDCRAALPEFPPDSAQLVLTSPPYYNARPEYAGIFNTRWHWIFGPAANATATASNCPRYFECKPSFRFASFPLPTMCRSAGSQLPYTP